MPSFRISSSDSIMQAKTRSGIEPKVAIVELVSLRDLALKQGASGRDQVGALEVGTPFIHQRKELPARHRPW